MMKDNDFDKCTNTFFDDDTLTIECKLGLWDVSGKDALYVIKVAIHYWRQYKGGGEYHEIIGGKSPAELLRGNYEQVIQKRQSN